MTLGIYIALAMAAALAVSRISQILMSGSLFEGFRELLKDYVEYPDYTDKREWRFTQCDGLHREYVGERLTFASWLAGWLHKLLTCDLCTTTQVAIWFVAVPGVMVYLGVRSKFLAVPYFGFMAAMAVSELSRGFIYVFNFPKKYIEEIGTQANELLTENQRQFDAMHAETKRQFDERVRLTREIELAKKKPASPFSELFGGLGGSPFGRPSQSTLSELAIIEALLGKPGMSSPFSTRRSAPESDPFGFGPSPLDMDDEPDRFAFDLDEDFSFGQPEPQGNSTPIGLGDFRRLVSGIYGKYRTINCPRKRAGILADELERWSQQNGASPTTMNAMRDIVELYEDKAYGRGKVSDEQLKQLYSRYLSEVHPFLSAQAARR